MTGVAKTNETVESNLTPANQSRIYIGRLADATYYYHNWDADSNKRGIFWSKYQIKETDMRVKTATFTSNTYLDLTTGLHAVLITSPYHEDFSGIILSVEKDTNTGLYNYQCQDWTRQYQAKWEIVFNNITLHRLLKTILTFNALPLTGDISKKEKNWKTTLSGLRPAYQYDQKSWGGSKDFNPMTQSLTGIVKGKSSIEIIRDYVFGSGAYIDVYANKYGVIQIEPYHKQDWLKSCVEITLEEIQDMKVSFDTTNIVTSVEVESKEQLEIGKGYTSKDVVGLDLSSIFGNNQASISNPNKNTSNTSKSSSSTSSAKKTNGNPYGTKKKNVYISSDNIKNKSSDKQFMEDLGKKLKKNGWSYKIVGLGPNFHSEKYAKKYKDGVWFCIYGGADPAVFKECTGNNSYTKTLKKNNLRTVIGMRTGVVSGKPCDIRKGGKCYSYLKRAHDDNYSKSSFKGLKNPLDVLTKGKVPIMYESTADKMAAKFLAGGDNPKAC